MVFVRLKERFHHRASEWFCAANLMWWGLGMLHPSNAFDSSVAYAAFQRTITEEHMAQGITVVGLMWLIGLIINGAKEQMTVVIRAVCALVGGVVYLIMSLGFLSSYLITGVLSTAVSTYFMISVLAFYSLFWIARQERSRHD